MHMELFCKLGGRMDGEQVGHVMNIHVLVVLFIFLPNFVLAQLFVVPSLSLVSSFILHRTPTVVHWFDLLGNCSLIFLYYHLYFVHTIMY